MFSPWWDFAPVENTYAQETQPTAPPLAVGAPPEVFAFVGARAKVRVYDVFLEGQFRRSDLTCDDCGGAIEARLTSSQGAPGRQLMRCRDGNTEIGRSQEASMMHA
jgi:hypothetical protein